MENKLSVKKIENYDIPEWMKIIRSLREKAKLEKENGRKK